MYTFEMTGKAYETDEETIKVLRDIVPSAKAAHDYSAVAAVMYLGLDMGIIKELV